MLSIVTFAFFSRTIDHVAVSIAAPSNPSQSVIWVPAHFELVGGSASPASASEGAVASATRTPPSSDAAGSVGDGASVRGGGLSGSAAEPLLQAATKSQPNAARRARLRIRTENAQKCEFGQALTDVPMLSPGPWRLDSAWDRKGKR